MNQLVSIMLKRPAGAHQPIGKMHLIELTGAHLMALKWMLIAIHYLDRTDRTIRSARTEFDWRTASLELEVVTVRVC